MLIKINKESDIPLVGTLAFGIIDRATNSLQIRPTTVCNISCTFCSTDAGITSKYHKINYEVEKDYLVAYLKEIIKFKGNNIQIMIDSVGEPTTYPNLVEL